MHPFVYARATTAQGAIETHHLAGSPREAPSVRARSQYLAGGTNLIDLMRLDVMQPELVTDINALERTPSGRIEYGARGLWVRPAAMFAEEVVIDGLPQPRFRRLA